MASTWMAEKVTHVQAVQTMGDSNIEASWAMSDAVLSSQRRGPQVSSKCLNRRF